ncbi:neural-cadherin-like [Physella acuta]|uniref:neural-cadherin-like n=1 Tax=Physella acuta TaxID=109671 RepID=UPI0027DB2A2C|nr:neural-cadherin-like [Physella acuta]
MGRSAQSHLTPAVLLLLLCCQSYSAASRLRRAVTNVTYTSSPIAENVNNDVTLFDLNTVAPNRRFEVTDNSAKKSNMFSTANGRLTLSPSLSATDRKLLDYDKYPDFFVFVRATNISDPNDILQMSIVLKLTNVDDEPPVITNKPQPYLATLSTSAAPGTVVYMLTASDPDSDLTRLKFEIKSQSPSTSPSRFILGQTDGILKTVGEAPFTAGIEFTVTISVTDPANNMLTADIKVLIGQRPPQFFSTTYTGQIYESVKPEDHNRVLEMNGSILVVSVKQFQTGPVQLLLADQSSSQPYAQYFDNPSVVSVANSVYSFNIQGGKTIDYENVKLMTLVMVAKEINTGLSSTVSAVINVLDENDNAPVFGLAQYSTRQLENVAINSTILTVTATDKDSGPNAELTFSVEDGNFTVDTTKDPSGSGYLGAIKLRRALDYELTRKYEFKVKVTDGGKSPLTSEVLVEVTVDNVNDNSPVIDNSTNKFSLNETAPINSILGIIQASDADGDKINFYLNTPNQTVSEIFKIDAASGLLQLNSAIPKSKDYYQLTVLAVDSDTCCSVKVGSRTSSAFFTVNIIDVNINKPNFNECAIYDINAKVKEKSPIGTKVIQVRAFDPDRGENGKVIYAIASPDPSKDGPFVIDANTGNITVQKDIVRPGEGYIQVTVVGRNPSIIPMEGWCTFKVNIQDINDNPPKFTADNYKIDILITTPATSAIRQMVATDADVGPNANITYSFYNRSNYFSINSQTGVIQLTQSLTNLGQATTFTLFVVANDNGIDPGPLTGNTTVTIAVNTANRTSPVWQNLPSTLEFNVIESASYGYVIATFRCQSNAANPKVEFLVYESIDQTSITFVPTPLNDTAMNLTLSNRLDYLVQKQYRLTVACQTLDGFLLRTDINPVINIIDANNQKPTFQGLGSNDRYVGTVPENALPGALVIQVSADDRDETLLFRTVTFVFLDNETFFDIQPAGMNRAEVKTKVTFDRELRDSFSVGVKASDGAPAAYPAGSTEPNSVVRYIDVTILDVNDNPPYFDQLNYTCSISEAANVNDRVCNVVALDVDTIDAGKLTYRFNSGNVNNAFSITSMIGEIRVARKLDYENPTEPKVYGMQLLAIDSDSLHTATTSVYISVLDANDNSPEFSMSRYVSVNQVQEEDTNNSPDRPFFLLQVTATDKDVARPETLIRYYLMGDVVNFTIEAETGKVFLIGSLDRDRGNPNYTFTVRAEDERVNPNYGYAEIVVSPMDINDNSPEFVEAYLIGNIQENSPPGTLALTVLARDPDAGENGTVSYQKYAQQNSSISSLFNISSSGQIVTAGPPQLYDREENDFFKLIVEAYDGGRPSRTATATVTINLIDVNDQAPYFEKPLYSATMSEALKAGSVLVVPAIDKDKDPSNRQLTFSIVGSNRFFMVTTSGQSANIQLANPVDYESDPHSFTFTLTVTDGMAGHQNSTQIQINVTDYNDNAPQFNGTDQSITLVEEENPGKAIATFFATDADSGINAQFEYSIVRSSDPRYEFYIDPSSGVVYTRKRLDREVAPFMDLVIMAKDKGEIPLNSTIKLKVTLIDINDNAPSFAKDYQPQVTENENLSNKLVVEIFAFDPDTEAYGPPFGFSEMCSVPACSKFSIKFNPANDNGRGTASIFTSSTFDREESKYYYLPIVMWDMRGKSSNISMTATNTLTITVADKNDNDLKPGNQEILVYDYQGLFGDVEIGRVYVEDPDDWDLPDKTFSNLRPSTMQNYFSVSPTNGMITMKKGVPVTAANSPYKFQVDVYDKVWQKTVTSTVSVTVQELSDEAVWKSGAVKLSGISSEEFIKPSSGSSMYSKFKATMATILGYPSPDNVQIVSLTDVGENLDVRFSAHASPYLSASQIESALMLNQDQFEKGVGAKVQQVPINLCVQEVYDDGCTTYYNVTGQPRLVNSNGTSYVVMSTSTTAQMGCLDSMFPDPVQCRGDYCFNGGTCIQDDWNKLSCECMPGFDGPRCQQRRHYFNGTSVSFYNTLSLCSEGRTSIEFITTQENGVLMYSGPVDNTPQSPSDYMQLELFEGYPVLTVNYGSQELTIRLNGTTGTPRLPKLNNGAWHRIDIDKFNKQVTMTVDHCMLVINSSTDGRIQDWSSCQVTGTVPGTEMFLNVESFLQLGGRYQRSATDKVGFNGCLRNLMHNSKLYDLYYKPIPNWMSGDNGCQREATVCGEGLAQPVCGQLASCESQWSGAGDTVAKCRCQPGWYGDKCSKEAPTYDLQKNSYIQWSVSANLISQLMKETSLQMTFRTRQKTGTLFIATDASQNIFLLQLVNGILTLRYNMGAGESQLSLSDSPANTGQWHTVLVQRFGSEFVLLMDGGEGRNFQLQPADISTSAFFRLTSPLNVGARVQPNSNGADVITDDLAQTCVRDIRLNDNWLPMTASQTSQVAGLSFVKSSSLVSGCNRTDCGTGVVCPVNTECHPLWEAHDCRCVPGYNSVSGVCVSVCQPNPCFQGTCTVVSGKPTCVCPSGMTGQYCDQMAVVDDSSLSGGAIAGIVIAIIVLLALLLALLIFVCVRSKDDEKEKNILEVDPDDDFIRENVMFYDEEGAGEEDHEAYDITLLQRPGMETSARPNEYPDKRDEMSRRNAPEYQMRDPYEKLERPDVGSFINGRINDAENEEPFGDSTHEFNFEGGNSDAGSLSSLNTSSSGGSQDYDYLSEWGPKFAKLADMYGAGQSDS